LLFPCPGSAELLPGVLPPAVLGTTALPSGATLDCPGPATDPVRICEAGEFGVCNTMVLCCTGDARLLAADEIGS